MDILLAARVGDLDRVRYLVEERGHDVNIINEYDVSPLYNAALCGHTHVVKYLLEKGAVAEENTYMGERVFYAALTDDLRRFLRHYGQSTAAHRDPYLEALRKLYEQRDSLWPDLTLVLGDTQINVHRVILRCRCPYFEKAFAGKWKDRTTITLSRHASPEVMQALIQYMYTGRLELPAHLAQEGVRVCSKMGLEDLVEALEDRLAGLKIRRCRDGNVQLMIEARREWLERDYSRLAGEVTGRLFVRDADVCVHCDGRYLSLHRVLLCFRCPYFHTLFTCPFFAEAAQFLPPSTKQSEPPSSQRLARGMAESRSAEAHTSHMTEAEARGGVEQEEDSTPASSVVRSGALPTVRVYEVSASAFAQVVEWCYSDSIRDLRVPLVVEVLEAATRFLLDGLRSLCTSFLIQHSDQVELLSLLHIATLYSLPRLEHHCLSLFARDLDEVIDSVDFMQLVLESAASIEARQETDSIPLLDDIRHHIQRLHVTQPEEMHRKYDLVDRLLDKLNLSA